MRLPLLTRRLHREYYEKEDRTPTTFNTAPSKVAAVDLRRVFSSTRKGDVEFVEKLAQRPWKMIDREKMQFKVVDKPYDYDVQFYFSQPAVAKKDRLAKFILSGRGTASLPIMNMDFARMPKVLAEKLGGFGVTVQSAGGGAVSMNLSEHFYKKYTAREHLQKNPTETKTLLFNVINALRDYKEQYPNFIHGNLNIDNVEVYPFRSSFREDSSPIQVGGSVFSPPSLAGKAMIGGFGSSTFSGEASPSKDVSTFVQSIADVTGDSKMSSLAKRMATKHTFEAIMGDEYFKDFQKNGGGMKSSNKMFGGEDEDEDEDEAEDAEEVEDETSEEEITEDKKKKTSPLFKKVNEDEEDEEKEDDEEDVVEDDEEDDEDKEEEDDEADWVDSDEVKTTGISWLDDKYDSPTSKGSRVQQHQQGQKKTKQKKNALYNILGADAILNGSRRGRFGMETPRQAQDYGLIPYGQMQMQQHQQHPHMQQQFPQMQQQYPHMQQQQYQPGTGMAGLQPMSASSFPSAVPVSSTYQGMMGMGMGMPPQGGGGDSEVSAVPPEPESNLSDDDFFFQANPIR
jgi:hypothetical protein